MTKKLMEDLLDMKCREFVTTQSAGEWTPEMINGDALLLREFILANAELVAVITHQKRVVAENVRSGRFDKLPFKGHDGGPL